MNTEIFGFLKKYSSQPTEVDRLIVSTFLGLNDRKVTRNTFLLKYVITAKDREEFSNLLEFRNLVEKEVKVFDFEHLIELFEFVISPADKVINGAVYTPNFIRTFLVQELFAQSSKKTKDLLCVDLACGCGGFLLNIAATIKEKTGKSFSEIFRNNIYGLDITGYSIVRAKLLLSLFALFKGEDATFRFNLETGNALSYNWLDNYKNVNANGGFDIIAGNPPYVASRNMDDISLKLMRDWSVTSTGHPDLYIPFFQVGFEQLAEDGMIGFITVNTFIKSINGRAVREYFSTNAAGLRIINFGGEQIFKGRNTYTCLCFIDKQRNRIEYYRTSSHLLSSLEPRNYQIFKYSDLNNKDGWNLVNSKEIDSYIRHLESVGKQFKDIYITKNGIATLKNDIYKFTPIKEDRFYYYFRDNDVDVQIEKGICRNIINANKIKSEEDLNENDEKIIFPYRVAEGKVQIILEKELISQFPKTYKYLLTKKSLLATRDKGKRIYEEWYAYGRRQSMDVNSYKLFFPHICERPRFVISKDKSLLFYNGIAVISNDLEELVCLKKILSSEIFYEYIKATTKDYSSGYISLSRNYVKNFGIYQMSASEKKKLLNSSNSELLLKSWYIHGS